MYPKSKALKCLEAKLSTFLHILPFVYLAWRCEELPVTLRDGKGWDVEEGEDEGSWVAKQTQ